MALISVPCGCLAKSNGSPYLPNRGRERGRERERKSERGRERERKSERGRERGGERERGGGRGNRVRITGCTCCQRHTWNEMGGIAERRRETYPRTLIFQFSVSNSTISTLLHTRKSSALNRNKNSSSKANSSDSKSSPDETGQSAEKTKSRVSST